MDKNSKYLVMPNDGSIPPNLPKDKEWYIMKMSLSIIAKNNFQKRLSEETLNTVCPSFLLVATDKEAAKMAMNEMIDDLFNAWDNNKDK
jgi:hypothetical protein